LELLLATALSARLRGGMERLGDRAKKKRNDFAACATVICHDIIIIKRIVRDDSVSEPFVPLCPCLDSASEQKFKCVLPSGAFLHFLLCPAWGTPIMFNVPATAAPGNIVSLEGSGLGSSPKIYFRPFTSTTPISVKIIKGDNNYVAFQVPSGLSFDVYFIAVSDGSSWSKTVGLNYPASVAIR
jgi:hypothetical protein